MKITVLLGPTSTGKTSLALKLAKEYNGEIISADSRQIYKYMDIGTGKLPIGSKVTIEKKDNKWVLDGINVWGYDLVSPGEYFSAYDYAKFALDKIQEIEQRGKKVFLVGGTGFYIDAVTGKTKIEGGNPDFSLRSELEKLSLEELQIKLKSLNHEVYLKIDQKNKVRLIRAIEKELSNTNSIPLPLLKDTQFIQIGLSAERKILFEKTDKWLEYVWENGLVTETNDLINKNFADAPQLHGLVYKSVFAFLNNELSEEEAKTRAKYDLHSYIRRQLTWFKRDPSINWFDITEETFSKKVSDNVKSYIYG